jgi:hypothetical protein
MALSQYKAKVTDRNCHYSRRWKCSSLKFAATIASLTLLGAVQVTVVGDAMWEKRISLSEIVWPIKFVNPTRNDLYQGCPNNWLYHIHRASPFESDARFFKIHQDHQDLFSTVLSRKISKQDDYSVKEKVYELKWIGLCQGLMTSFGRAGVP